MQDDRQKPAATDAQPGAGPTKPDHTEEPGKAPKLSETDAHPDSSSSDDVKQDRS